jgi:hypothetical protein
MTLTLMQRGRDFLRSKVPQAAREFVNYYRGAQVIEGLEVVQGQSFVERYDVDGQDGTYKAIDWIVMDPAAFRFGDEHVEPAKGDIVERFDELGRTQRYMVLPVPGGRQFEVVDERIGPVPRIHSKQISD